MSTMSMIRQAIMLCCGLTVLTGIAYPMFITGIAQTVASDSRMGSPVLKSGSCIGYRNIGQSWNDSTYFWSRPSSVEYRPIPSSGSNLGPTSRVLRDSITARRIRLATSSMIHPQRVPADMLTSSASGLDPHISPEAAYMQLYRVAHVRHYRQESIDRLRALIDSCTEQPQFGFLGMPRVNVLELNRRLHQFDK